MPDDHTGLATAERTIQGLNESGLAAFNDGFHALVDDAQLAGVVTLIARRGEVVNFDAYGKLDASTDVPVQKDSIFRLASMTKPIIGAAMMMLWEEGKWALDDPVAKHIPEFEGLKVRVKDGDPVAQATPMTMRQLMSHSAGFGRLAEYQDTSPRDDPRAAALGPGSVLRRGDLKDMIATLAKLPLSFQPGTQWRYGPSVDIQGYVIEQLSGQGLDEFLQQRLFGPLGMVDTGFWVAPANGHRVSRIHKYDDAGKITVAGESNSFNTAKPKFLSGGGGLVGTAQDYWRFAQMILDGGEFGGRRYLKASTVELMHTNVLAPGVEVTLYFPDTVGLGFGMDFAIVQDPVAAKTSQGVESFYWGGAFGTWFWIDPINQLIVVGLIQNMAGSQTAAGNPAVRELSARAVYAAMTDRKP